MISKILIYLIFLFPLHAREVSSDDYAEKERRGKIEIIMRSQDTRTIHDGKLVSFLSDPDPVVRERTLLAYGSIQDSSVIDLLVESLNDDNIRVQSAAAFAIGQTAQMLGTAKKQRLQHDLIWNRIDLMNPEEGKNQSPAGRMIEEIGKFGTVEALDDLMLRFGNLFPRIHTNSLIMCIARFAIRNIVSETAAQ